MSSSRESSKRKKEANEIPEWIGDATSAVPESLPPLHKRRAGRDPRRCSHAPAAAPAPPLPPPHRGKEQSSRSSLLVHRLIDVLIGGPHLWLRASPLGGWVFHPPAHSALWTRKLGPVTSSTKDSSQRPKRRPDLAMSSPRAKCAPRLRRGWLQQADVKRGRGVTLQLLPELLRALLTWSLLASCPTWPIYFPCCLSAASLTLPHAQ
ncbi:uncharacterized protein LOC106021942 isoform X10 [Mesocricetus auratus]|uniref:Uncharacterized protein LOC106021942 isoform X10 n=1 Tax=Mesocricetus auratus TaxID=10036 RepID=A0ABM2Y133_MESAU|nr:uncharacterized protein LOC106021942 isoform X10 [Mesocricetus auratus]